jgi:hypothetical protein
MRAGVPPKFQEAVKYGMQYELVFRGSLVQYWHAVHAEWLRSIRKYSDPNGAFRLSHAVPPQPYEEVTIEFMDSHNRLGLVTVDALSGSNGNLVKLIVHIEREAYQETAQIALKKWERLKNSWLRKGRLFDPLVQPQGTNIKPAKIPRPKQGSSMDAWFDWFHNMQALGIRCTLKEIAQETGYSYGRVRQLHAVYLNSRVDRSS